MSKGWGPRKSVRKIPLDYSKAAKRLGAKIRAVREALGVGREEAARKMGFVRSEHYKYYAMVEDGKVFPTEEWAKRFVAWAWEHKSFEQVPTIKMDIRRRMNRHEYTFPVSFSSEAEQKRIFAAAEELGCSVSAFVQVACQRMLDGFPPMTELGQFIKLAEELRVKRILEHNPSINMILAGDDLLAQYVHRTQPEKVVTIEEEQTSLSRIESLSPESGPSDPVMLPLAKRLFEV
jgi:hypothetical protein